MTQYNLFLDDARVPNDVFSYTKDADFSSLSWVIVRSYDEFVELVEDCFADGKFPRLVSFDHDLHDAESSDRQLSEKTGMDCAKWLVNFCMEKKLDLPSYKVHSMNPVSKANIQSYLESYSKVQHKL